MMIAKLTITVLLMLTSASAAYEVVDGSKLPDEQMLILRNLDVWPQSIYGKMEVRRLRKAANEGDFCGEHRSELRKGGYTSWEKFAFNGTAPFYGHETPPDASFAGQFIPRIEDKNYLYYESNTQKFTEIGCLD